MWQIHGWSNLRSTIMTLITSWALGMAKRINALLFSTSTLQIDILNPLFQIFGCWAYAWTWTLKYFFFNVWEEKLGSMNISSDSHVSELDPYQCLTLFS
jgi:hypothetical protein